MIVTIKTDTGVVELSLMNRLTVVESTLWDAGRTMANGLLAHIDELLRRSAVAWEQLDGIAVYRGPGSFTSLRIGITTANTIAYALSLPIVGTEGEAWLETAIQRLDAGEDDRMVIPVYGADPHITAPRK